ncbi:hypothetical protein [Polaromonas sp. DSR2-3-2]|uniref:hypothetical protein n=1 Tax=unclassified Polaromonas TaxID=2638319 RepID=UPI003CEF2E11
MLPERYNLVGFDLVSIRLAVDCAQAGTMGLPIATLATIKSIAGCAGPACAKSLFD